ncbi:MAG: hypothetical protein IRZ08_21485, partial [Frankia sp.]|nr:hypothetical protein [Frankia sp.]
APDGAEDWCPLAPSAAATSPPDVVVVDDAELLTDVAVAPTLAGFLRGARDGRRALVAAGTTEDLLGQYRGFTVDARRSRCGLILAPAGPGDGELFGARLPRVLCSAARPGRGLLVRHGQLTAVQVATPDREEPGAPVVHSPYTPG